MNVLGDLEKRLKKIKKDPESCRRGLLSEESVRRELLRFKRERLEEELNAYWEKDLMSMAGKRRP